LAPGKRFSPPARRFSSTSQIATMSPCFAASFESLCPLPSTPMEAMAIRSLGESFAWDATPPATQNPAAVTLAALRKRRRLVVCDMAGSFESGKWRAESGKLAGKNECRKSNDEGIPKHE
jgi:hypothetical protein